MADFDRSTFGTTKARAVDHGEINARSKGQPAGDAFQKKASEWLDPDAESKVGRRLGPNGASSWDRCRHIGL